MAVTNFAIGNTLYVFFVLFLIFGGAYKTPYGILSVSIVIFILAAAKFLFSLGDKRTYNISLFYQERYFMYQCIVLVLLFFYSLTLFVFFDDGDLSFVNMQLKQFSIAIISSLMFYYLIKNKIKEISFPSLLFGVCCFFIFMITLLFVQMTNPSFRIEFIEITALDGHWLEFATNSLRGIGLQGLSIWDTSLAFSFFCFISIAALKNRYYLVFIIMQPMLLTLTVLSGRAGLIYYFVFLILGLMVIKKIKELMMIMAMSFLIVFVLYASDNLIVHSVLNFALELFINVSNGDVASGSTNDLINNHLFVPEIENAILGDNIYIGDGDIFTSKINRSSDSAFVINYAAYGVLGVLATIILVCITTRIISDCYTLDCRTNLIIRKSVSFFSFILALGIYIKVPLYVSATLLKSMVFVSIVITSINANKVKVEV